MPGSPLAVSRRDLIAEGKKADVALDFEDVSVIDGPKDPWTWARSRGAARAAGR